jgi:hypothetical protein
MARSARYSSSLSMVLLALIFFIFASPYCCREKVSRGLSIWILRTNISPDLIISLWRAKRASLRLVSFIEHNSHPARAKRTWKSSRPSSHESTYFVIWCNLVCLATSPVFFNSSCAIGESNHCHAFWSYSQIWCMGPHAAC